MAQPTKPTTQALVTDGYAGANLTSYPISILAYPLVSVHGWFSAGTPSGTVTLEFSNEENLLTDGYAQTVVGPAPSAGLANAITKWISAADIKNFPVANAFTAVTVTSGSSFGLNFQNIGFKWMRLVYTSVSGTGTLQVRVEGKRNKASNT